MYMCVYVRSICVYGVCCVVACVWYVWCLCSVCGKCVHGVCGSTINKNPETDIGLQPEDQKSKATSHLYLSLKVTILPSGNLRIRQSLEPVSSHLYLIPTLERNIRREETGFYGKLGWLLELKVCAPLTGWSVWLISDTVYSLIFRKALFIKI